nr:unnamed protein product [Callosobruchus analis]
MDMATDQEIVSDNEDKDELQESTDHTEDVFNQLQPSSSGTPGHSAGEIQELSEDIQERIRQNKERAERLRLERLQRARDQAAIALPGSSRLAASQLSQNEHVNKDLFSNQTEKQTEEGTIEDLIDESNSQEELSKNKSAVIYCDEEIHQNEDIEKTKSSSTNKRASTKHSHLESSEDETSEPEKGQKRASEALVNGSSDQDFEVKIKKKKVKVIDSDSDSELNDQETQSKMLEGDDQDVNNDVEEDQEKRSLYDEKAKKRGKVIDSDDEDEGTIDELLHEINTTESLNKANSRNIESDEDMSDNSRRDNNHSYRKKLRTIQSNEEENNSDDFTQRKTEDTNHIENHIESDREEFNNENNINKENVDKQTQEAKVDSQSMLQHDRKRKINEQADILTKTNN